MRRPMVSCWPSWWVGERLDGGGQDTYMSYGQNMKEPALLHLFSPYQQPDPWLVLPRIGFKSDLSGYASSHSKDDKFIPGFNRF